jgi:hypothetical protein
MVHGGVEVEVDRKIERVTVCDLPFRVYRAGRLNFQYIDNYIDPTLYITIF